MTMTTDQTTDRPALTDGEIDCLTGQQLDIAVTLALGHRVEDTPNEPGRLRFRYETERGTWVVGGDLLEYHRDANLALSLLPEIYRLTETAYQMSFGLDIIDKTLGFCGWPNRSRGEYMQTSTDGTTGEAFATMLCRSYLKAYYSKKGNNLP